MARKKGQQLGNTEDGVALAQLFLCVGVRWWKVSHMLQGKIPFFSNECPPPYLYCTWRLLEAGGFLSTN